MASRQKRLPKTRTSTAGVWFLVAIPAAAVLACGILILVYQQSIFDVTIGLLLLCFCGAIGAGVTLTLVGINSDRKLAALQIDFVSKVSHELKTPLTSIRMFVETLRLGRVTETKEIERCLGVIQKEAERLSSLIGRLLSWGAMEAGEFRIAFEPIRPQALMDEAISAFEPQRLHAGIELTVDAGADLPWIEGDQPALTDALLNLLNNAAKYCGAAKRIELACQLRPDERIAFSVTDHGIGIELRHHRKIFERFYRADERYNRGVGGTGLGLAIARHIVLAHAGTIEMKSKVGEGSTFTIVLPIRRTGRANTPPTRGEDRESA